jgi:antitoxin component YwqK of YwqJK toxin-antitoxin module
MKAFSTGWHIRIGILSALAISVALCGQVQAQSAAGNQSSSSAPQESVKIEPYKGPPIYLDEPQQVVVEPTVVTKETIHEVHGGGKVDRDVAHYSDNSFAADGNYREYHPNGKIFIEGQFRKGRQEGEWKFYFDNGQVNRKATYKDGKPNGSWEIYRADGTAFAKRGFKDGLRDGEWITYDETGKKPLNEEHYIAGEQDGIWKTWFPSGKQKQQVSFKNGKREGTSIDWDEKGQKIIEAEWSDNKLNGTATRCFSDGRKTVIKYENGRLIDTK